MAEGPQARTTTWILQGLSRALGWVGAVDPQVEFRVQPVLLAGDARDLSGRLHAPGAFFGRKLPAVAANGGAVRIATTSPGGATVEAWFQNSDVTNNSRATLVFLTIATATPLVAPAVLPPSNFGPEPVSRTIVTVGSVIAANIAIFQTLAPTFRLDSGGTTMPIRFYLPAGQAAVIFSEIINQVCSIAIRVVEHPAGPGA